MGVSLDVKQTVWNETDFKTFVLLLGISNFFVLLVE